MTIGLRRLTQAALLGGAIAISTSALAGGLLGGGALGGSLGGGPGGLSGAGSIGGMGNVGGIGGMGQVGGMGSAAISPTSVGGSAGGNAGVNGIARLSAAPCPALPARPRAA